MGAGRVQVTVGAVQLALLDRLVESGEFASRDDALREAVLELVTRLTHERLARESAKLGPGEEIALAEEGLGGDVAEWPEY